MGADILTSNSMYNTPYNDNLMTPNNSQYRIHFNPSSSGGVGLFNQQYLDKSFQFNEESLNVLAKQEIVQNNFSQEFDPLFTNFRQENKNMYGKFRILCSNITNEKIQQYRITFKNQKDFKTYLLSYFWRKHHSDLKDWPLVKTTNLKIYDDSKRLLKGGVSGFISRNCTSSKQIYCKVYVEDIPLRLCHIKDIPFPQNLYVLRQVLRGFHTVYQNIGYIKPFGDLICITRKGIVKLWINSDLSKNFPNIQNIDENITSSKSESKLINQILSIVLNNSDPSGQPISFSAYLKQQHVNMQFISFEKIFQMLTRYQLDYEIEIPDTFSSMVQVLNQQQEQYDTYRTDMQHGNQQKGGSSSHRLIKYQNKSGSALFLDVPNNSSRLKGKNNNRDKSSSNIDRGQKSSKRKNKTHKTQSLKIGQEQHHSLSSSIAGVKSNVILSESLPISRGLNQQTSSNQIGGQSGFQSNKDISKSKQQESGSQIQKLNEVNFIQIDKFYENRQSDQINNIEDPQTKQISKSSIPFGKNSNNSPKIQHIGLPIHHQLTPSQLLIQQQNYKKAQYQMTPSIPIIKQINQSYHQSQQQNKSVQIHSNNQLKLNENQGEYTRNKKTYSNLWMDKKVQLDDHDQQLQLQHVQMTYQQLEHMKEIDKFLQAQVIKQENQKLTLFQVYKQKKQSNHMLKSQHQINSTPYKPNSSSKHQNSSNNLTIPLILPPPPSLKKQSSSQISSKHQQISPQMISSRQHQFSHSHDSRNHMHSSHHLPHLEQLSYDSNVMNSHIVQRSSGLRPLSNHENNQQHSIYNPQQAFMLNNQHILSPQSSLNHQQNLQYQHNSNTQIQIQPPSSSRNGQNSSTNIFQSMDNNKNSNQYSSNNVIISTISNNVLTPINQFYPTNTPHTLLVSSTSIGHSGYTNIQNTPQTIVIKSPSQSSQIPKVTFAVKTPQQLSYSNVQSSKNMSLNQIAYSQQSSYLGHLPGQQFLIDIPLSISNQGQPSIHHIQILANRTNTAVSNYMFSQGGQSSRKYYDHESNSSKPSIVEYTYLRNPQYFAQINQQEASSNIFQQQNQQIQQRQQCQNLQSPVLIPQRSQQNSLDKLPILQPSQQQVEDEENNSSNRSPIKKIIGEQLYKQPQLANRISHQSNYYQAHPLDITPIPEQVQLQMFNNSRSLVNNDYYFCTKNSGYMSNSNSQLDHQQQYCIDNMDLPQESPTYQHKRQSSGIKVVQSQKDQKQFISQSQQENFNMSPSPSYIQQNRQNNLFVSQDCSQLIFQAKKSAQNDYNQHPQVKINIRPSFQSISNNSQNQNQQYSNKSCRSYSKQQNRSSFNSGQQPFYPINNLMVKPKASDQGSNPNEQPTSNYRFVESIEENHPNSTYQMDVDMLQKENDFVINQADSGPKHHGHHHQDKKFLNTNFSGIYNVHGNPNNHHRNDYDMASHSPTQSQNQSPRLHKLPNKPVTGRTMFLNNDNELTSEFIDPQSQRESEVDYTYNSYDKWKDKSRIDNYGPSRFREFDQKCEQQEQGQGTNRKFNNIAFNYPQRHGHHKQLVKSSIEGTKLLGHHFNRRQNYNTDKKQEQKAKDSNQVYFEAFQPQKRMQLTGFRLANAYRQEQIDQDILNDLREV